MARINIPDMVYSEIINETFEETPDEFVTKATKARLEKMKLRK